MSLWVHSLPAYRRNLRESYFIKFCLLLRIQSLSVKCFRNTAFFSLRHLQHQLSLVGFLPNGIFSFLYLTFLPKEKNGSKKEWKYLHSPLQQRRLSNLGFLMFHHAVPPFRWFQRPSLSISAQDKLKNEAEKNHANQQRNGKTAGLWLQIWITTMIRFKLFMCFFQMDINTDFWNQHLALPGTSIVCCYYICPRGNPIANNKLIWAAFYITHINITISLGLAHIKENKFWAYFDRFGMICYWESME